MRSFIGIENEILTKKYRKVLIVQAMEFYRLNKMFLFFVCLLLSILGNNCFSLNDWRRKFRSIFFQYTVSVRNA